MANELLTKVEIARMLNKSHSAIQSLIFRSNLASCGKTTVKGQSALLYNLDDVRQILANKRTKRGFVRKHSHLTEKLQNAICTGLMTRIEIAEQCGCHGTWVDKICRQYNIVPVAISDKKGHGFRPYLYDAELVLEAIKAIKRRCE